MIDSLHAVCLTIVNFRKEWTVLLPCVTAYWRCRRDQIIAKSGLIGRQKAGQLRLLAFGGTLKIYLLFVLVLTVNTVARVEKEKTITLFSGRL